MRRDVARFLIVILAKARTQGNRTNVDPWVLAFARMTRWRWRVSHHGSSRRRSQAVGPEVDDTAPRTLYLIATVPAPHRP